MIDFKTDNVPVEALSERVTYYRPQIEAYRRSVLARAHIPTENVTASLVFSVLDRVVRISPCE